MAHRNRPMTPEHFARYGVILPEADISNREYDPNDVYLRSENDRWAREVDVHHRPEVVQSGALPDQPPDLPVNATGETRRPFAF